MVVNMVIFLLILYIDFIYSGIIDVERRIINGTKAKIEDFPHSVALEELIGTKVMNFALGIWIFVCGGSIIKQNWVITAKHCVNEEVESNYRIVMGTSYLSIFWEKDDFLMSAEKYVINPKFDISLVKLESNLIFTSKVNKIELSLFTNDDSSNFSSLKFAGWGLDSTNSYFRSLWLRCIDVELDDKQVEDYFYTKGLNPQSGLCDGDSGSGLIVTVSGHKFLYGIASQSDQNCQNSMGPLISSHLSWIEEVIEKN